MSTTTMNWMLMVFFLLVAVMCHHLAVAGGIGGEMGEIFNNDAGNHMDIEQIEY